VLSESTAKDKCLVMRAICKCLWAHQNSNVNPFDTKAVWRDLRAIFRSGVITQCQPGRKQLHGATPHNYRAVLPPYYQTILAFLYSHLHLTFTDSCPLSLSLFMHMSPQPNRLDFDNDRHGPINRSYMCGHRERGWKSKAGQSCTTCVQSKHYHRWS